MAASVSKFDRAFEHVIGHEGGYNHDPRDPGGETKYGITKRTYPGVDIRNLTLEGAKAIYLRDFWTPLRCEEMPYRTAVNVFDGAVNSGQTNSIKWLQRAAGVAEDGILGPITMAAASKRRPLLAARYNAARLEFLTGLPTWPTFGKGWARRIAGNLKA